MIPTKTLRELTIEGINTVLTSLEGNDKKGNPILNITKMQKKIDDSGRWVSVDVLQQKLQEILESLQKYVALNPDGSIGEHLNKTFLRTENIVRELLVELELEEAKKQ